LAQRLAAAILPKVGNTANAGMIMDSIATGDYRYGNTEIDFSREFVAVRDGWVSDIRAKLKANWAPYLPSLGELLIIGGSANLLEPMCSVSKGALRLPPSLNFSICMD
jgi:hypothetical protein